MTEIDKLKSRFTSSNHVLVPSIRYAREDYVLLDTEVQSLADERDSNYKTAIYVADCLDKAQANSDRLYEALEKIALGYVAEERVGGLDQRHELQKIAKQALDRHEKS